MKLDVNVLRYLSKDEFRVLTAVEMGQKNHEIVPSTLVDTIARLKYDGYRLTNLGYDYLAIRTLTARGNMVSIGRKIGVGKEADIYEVADSEGNLCCLKLHRLGRTSFRAVKSKRDYLRQGSHYSWLYLSRLSAVKEFAFMKALGDRGLPVPRAIDQNRHAVLMSLVEAFPLCQVGKLMNPADVYTKLIDLMEQLAKMGLVHCDFNEFNVLISENEDITLIDFPQMVSTNHWNAEVSCEEGGFVAGLSWVHSWLACQELFERDVDCLIRFFSKKLGYVPSVDPDLPRVRPDFKMAAPSMGDLDADLRASGFKREDQEVLDSEMSHLQVSAKPRRRRGVTAAAVGEKLRDQQRRAARRAAVAGASRNATKGKNKGKKKGSGADSGIVWG
ncbi:hypothetical protein QBZ16_000320 [Prototheca wickerhamii]|uniref:non-specific serine/threonine protein kinase n=1 Tax=Prototheca wickerhamii TaxID=3111 RepID=A0AAD9IPB7_PROWI|nr:hypothetical protein QBZ16_000320 [Prototheca wickerhamii]